MTNDLKGYKWWQEEIMLLWENQMITYSLTGQISLEKW